MIDIKWQAESALPPILDRPGDATVGYASRISVRDPDYYFQSNPLFADRADASWFLARAWNGIPPTVGRQKGESLIRTEFDKYVVMHRYGEGVIFDCDGASSSPGFLSNMQTLPPGLEKHGDGFVAGKALLDSAPHFPGSYLIFFNGNLQNYYHWMVEGMLALHLLDQEDSEPNQTILPANLPAEGRFDHVGIIRLLGHEALSIDRTTSPLVRCDSVIHLERGEVDAFPRSQLQAFQQKMSLRFGGSDGHRIFIKRRHLRGVDNEADVGRILEAKGFRPYVLEEMTAEEQFRLFASASFVVSPHGAGMSNLMFTPPGCKVLELMPECEMRPFFWQLSSKLDHGYGMLPCPTHDGGFNGRLRVDLDKFQSLFSMLEHQR